MVKFVAVHEFGMAHNVIHGAAKGWSLSDQQRANCAVGLDQLRSV